MRTEEKLKLTLKLLNEDVQESRNEFNSQKQNLISLLEDVIEHIKKADSKEEILEHNNIYYDKWEDICHIDIYQEIDSLTYVSTKLQDAKDVLRMIQE